MAEVWNLLGPEGPGYLQRLERAALFLGVLGVGVVVTTLLTSLSTYGSNNVISVLLEVLAAAANVGMYFIGFRVLTPKVVATRKLLPGAVAAGNAWAVLQAPGTLVVHHLLHPASPDRAVSPRLSPVAPVYTGAAS